MKKESKIVSNLIWRFMERCGAYGVKFLVELVIARILLTEDYGLVALITVFIEILNVFVDSGMANALIQKKDADDLDFSSVFYFNMVLCCILYFLLFLAAPFIAVFYNNSSITLLVRILGIQLIISGIKNVQQAYVSRTMQFKRFFFSTLGGTIGAGVIGIVMACTGFGVWALVAQQLFNTTVDTLILWITVKWRPKWMFSLQRLKKLFSYGWKLLVSTLIDKVYTEIRSLLIGKIYSPADLAYYNRGEQFPKAIVLNVNTSIDSVLLPTMSDEQEDTERVKNMTRKAIKTSTYIMAPLMMGLCFTATPLIRLILTEKWLLCVPYLRIFCFTYMFRPIHTANLNAIKAIGRSDLFLKLEIIKKIVGLIALLIALPYGVMTMAYSLLFTNVISQIINAWPNRKLLNYSYWDQIKDILPNVLLALCMGMIVGLVGLLDLSDIITLCIQILLGIVIYVFGSIILKTDSFNYIVKYVKNMFERKRRDIK